MIGAGAWGTALGQAAAIAGRRVTIVGRDPAVIGAINRMHHNPKHLGTLQLSERVVAATELPEADLVILAVPAQASRAALTGLADRLTGKPVVLTAKGLEAKTLKRQSEVLAEMAPSAIAYVLSGPSFADDVAAGRPTAVTLAGDDPPSARTCARNASAPVETATDFISLLMNASFRRLSASKPDGDR